MRFPSRWLFYGWLLLLVCLWWGLVACQPEADGLPLVVPDSDNAPLVNEPSAGMALLEEPEKSERLVPELMLTPVVVDIPGAKRGLEPACGKLEGGLLALAAAADDPMPVAAANRLILTDEGVGVTLTLVAAASFSLDPYQGTLRNQHDTILEAYIPISQLCALANDDQVLKIQPLRPLTLP